MRTAICDDRAEDAQLVAQYVREWGESAALDIFPSAEAFLFEYSGNKSYELLLLDVEMGGMDGVTMAKRIRAGNAAVQIVFITGYTDPTAGRSRSSPAGRRYASRSVRFAGLAWRKTTRPSTPRRGALRKD